jgi:hypothetical protein
MFNWHETARLETGLPFADLLGEVRDELEEIGPTNREARNEIAVGAKRYSSFGYDARITATLEPGEANEYYLKIRYEIAPNVMAILCLLFWPLLIILLLMGQSSSQRMRREISDVLERIEDKYGRPKPVSYGRDDRDDDN